MAARIKNLGQGVEIGFISRSSPSPVFSEPEPAQYNIKIARMKARFRTSLQTEASDNINLSETNPKADISLNPHFKIGFVYQLSERQFLESNFGIGYKWHLANGELNTIHVDPTSSIDYKISLAGNVEVQLYDTFGLQVDPTSRPDIAGDDALLDFRRLSNTAGVLASWQPTRSFRLSAGYSYRIDRSLTDEFSSLDMDTHTVSSAAYYTFTPRLTTGLMGSYSLLGYAESAQSDGDSYNVGPVVVFRPTSFITVNAFVGYSVVNAAATATMAASSLNGVSANVIIDHRLNRLISHDIQINQGRFLGVNGQFNETLAAQYGMTVRLNSQIRVRGTFVYETLTGYGPSAEEAQRMLFYLGTGYQLTRKWSCNVGYAYANRDSDLEGRGYSQHRLTVNLNREF